MMENSHSVKIKLLADQYTRSKAEFHKALTGMEELACHSELEEIRNIEYSLEHSFTTLIEAPAKNIEELSIKADVFINEILSEENITNYQKKSLLSLLDDILTLRD